MEHNNGRIIHSIKKSFANPHYRKTRVNNTLLAVEDLLALFHEDYQSASQTVDQKILATAKILTSEFLGRAESLDTRVFTGGSSKLKNLQKAFHSTHIILK